MFTDDKTGLYNFRMFQTCLQHEFIAAKKRGIPLTLLFLDIDHFKKINDRFGHQTGDKILKLVAEQIKRNVRPTDFVARYGGEEIAVICPNTPLEAGREIALRLRYVVKNCTLDEDGELAQEKISVSIGIASSLTAQSKEELIDQADKCMYLAKKKGRDRVVSFNETD
jgi:diguanylate cyclase